MPSSIFNRIRLYSGLNYSLLLSGALRLMKAKLFKMPVMKYMDIALDYRCNMKCEHCFASKLNNNTENKHRITKEEYVKIANDARALGCLHFNLQGGEPLVMNDLDDYIKAINPSKSYISITTNGFLFTKQTALHLKDVGVNQVIFSLESLESESHDKFRKLEGSHHKVINAINNALEAKLNVSVNVTVSHLSLVSKGQKELFEWLMQHNIPFNPILACPVGAWLDRTEILVQKEDVAFIEIMRSRYKLLQRDIHASWVKQGCPAVLEQLYLTPYGDVMPCPFIHISLGNVHNEPISEIWRRCIADNLHGHYNPACWASENHSFIDELNAICRKRDDLPVPIADTDTLHFLKKYWAK